MSNKVIKSPPYLRLVHHVWYCEMLIPKDVKHYFGGKTKFYKTTKCKTHQVKLAEIKSRTMVMEWQGMIAQARSRSDDPIIDEALALQRYLKEYESFDKNNTPKDFPIEHDFNEFKDQIHDQVVEEIEVIRKTKGNEISQVVSSITFGKRKYLKNLIPDWEKSELKRRLTPKTIDSRKSNINLICQTFPTVDSFFKENNVKDWLNSIYNSGKYTATRITKICESGRSFYNYLEEIGEIKNSNYSYPISNPFVVPKPLRIGKNKKSKQQHFKESWIPMTVDEVICCYQSAIAKGNDQQLVDLILIGAYTGMRLDEICSLKCDDINLKTGSLNVIDSKTISGIREVPIHSKIKYRIKELINTSDDGYLISGLSFNKYNKRNNAIGSRFTRLKQSLGFPQLKVFHSIRKTVSTCFENHEVLENIVADIIGHDKPRMTYGTYSSGTILKIKKQKIELLNYDWDKKVKSPIQIIEDKEKKAIRIGKLKSTKP